MCYHTDRPHSHPPLHPLAAELLLRHSHRDQGLDLLVCQLLVGQDYVDGLPDAAHTLGVADADRQQVIAAQFDVVQRHDEGGYPDFRRQQSRLLKSMVEDLRAIQVDPRVLVASAEVEVLEFPLVLE